MPRRVSYTRRTGKRPFRVYPGFYGWGDLADIGVDAPEILPGPIWDRLEDTKTKPLSWKTYKGLAVALKAADDAYRKAVEGGAVEPLA